MSAWGIIVVFAGVIGGLVVLAAAVLFAMWVDGAGS